MASMFSPLPPSETEVVKDSLTKHGKTVGYITGTQAFAEMGQTTQISSRLLVGTNKYRRAVTRGQYTVSFLLQPNPIKKSGGQELSYTLGTQYIDLWSSSSLQGIAQTSLDSAPASFVTSLKQIAWVGCVRLEHNKNGRKSLFL